MADAIGQIRGRHDRHLLGPQAPAGHESNWLETPAGNGWWPWFRFFGPEEHLFEKTWKLPDVERLQ